MSVLSLRCVFIGILATLTTDPAQSDFGAWLWSQQEHPSLAAHVSSDGDGWFGAHGPPRTRLFLSSLVTHVFYGAGHWLGASILSPT